MSRPQDESDGVAVGCLQFITFLENRGRTSGEQQPRNIANTCGLQGNTQENALLHFRQELRQLPSNVERQIGLLTDLAERYVDFAADIAQIVEEAIRRAVPQNKMWHMQLLDAICQKAGGHEDVYRRLFAEKIIPLAVHFLKTAQGDVHSSILALRNKWNDVFPPEQLRTLDAHLSKIDSRRPPRSHAAGVGERQSNSQGNANQPQHGQGPDIPPGIQRQLDIEAAKRRGLKRVNTVLREQYTEEKKARKDAQKQLSTTESELAVQKERTVAAVRAHKETTKQNEALGRQISEQKALKTQLKAVTKQNKTLVRDITQLKARKTELKEVLKQNKTLVREISELKALKKQLKEITKQNKTLVRQISELQARKTELERANRALKRGENAAEIAKKMRPQEAINCRRNDLNDVITDDVVGEFRSWMRNKPVNNKKGMGPKKQVIAYVDEYLRFKRFPSERQKSKVRSRLISKGNLIVDERKHKVVRGMLKHV